MDIYATVTDKIINLLEQGVVPWRRPWTSAGLPRNLVSKKPYRGVNVFLPSASKYVSPFWLTYRQANELGGHVRKAEESMVVVFWKVDDAKQSTEALDNEETDGKRRAAGSCSDIIACSTSNNANCRKQSSINFRRLRRTSTIQSRRPSGSSATCRTGLRFNTPAQTPSIVRSPIALRCPRANCSLAQRNFTRLHCMRQSIVQAVRNALRGKGFAKPLRSARPSIPRRSL
jgi:hypothetical protein